MFLRNHDIATPEPLQNYQNRGWGVGCSEKEEYPYPKRYKAPAFKYGVPHTPHPTPNKTVHISSFVPILDICQQLGLAGIYFDRGQVVSFHLHV